MATLTKWKGEAARKALEFYKPMVEQGKVTAETSGKGDEFTLVIIEPEPEKNS